MNLSRMEEPKLSSVAFVSDVPDLSVGVQYGAHYDDAECFTLYMIVRRLLEEFWLFGLSFAVGLMDGIYQGGCER
ncbi:hypothetical protein D9756_003496 [Leucocoprinus leucothites]|uniref:Uncharacterized protein n=1 Tax=Leucocoprinus leucothites TaxID=201217 RepID=A0A8H5LJE8_9AGAR|nr:hypothetical protein D9756_003496 [Leucoagaricus leucothites]